MLSVFFFFNDTATTEIYTLSLHDALPISIRAIARESASSIGGTSAGSQRSRVTTSAKRAVSTFAPTQAPDRKSTRLNSSHGYISYAVFCLKKKKTTHNPKSAIASAQCRSY